MDSFAYDLVKNIEFVDIPYFVNGEINKQFYNGMNDKDGRTIKININSTPLTQSAIDERLGRSFNIPDENTLRAQTDYKDMKNNSLHYSDNVVFTLGEGADISYGTGRILDFVQQLKLF